jgi:hypothetical protein
MEHESAQPLFDPDRILSVLDRQKVEFVLVGGMAARAHGAARTTADIDCVPNTDFDNLDRLANALVELDARLRVAGMSDDEARQLPVRLDAATLASFGSSTWMTNAGPLDLLVELRDTSGARHRYMALFQRSVPIAVGNVILRLASLRDIVESKEFAGRPKDLEALPELRSLLDNEAD